MSEVLHQVQVLSTLTEGEYLCVEQTSDDHQVILHRQGVSLRDLCFLLRIADGSVHYIEMFDNIAKMNGPHIKHKTFCLCVWGRGLVVTFAS